MTAAPRKPTAREKLQASSLRPTQLELMGNDVDLRSLYLALNHKDINIIEAVQDVTVQRTIQGASTITVPVYDRDGTLLRSGRLSSKNDIEIDGLFFRLVAVKKAGKNITLTFEDREVSVLRTYDKPIKQSMSTSRLKVTRAEFVLRMLREVKEFKIKYNIPELHKTQPIDTYSQLPDSSSRVVNRSYGIPKANDLTVKGDAMTEVQRRNAEAVLDTGVTYLAPLKTSVVRKCLVMSMMACIQESTMTNLSGGDLDSVGILQQRASMGWPATRNIPVDAQEFFTRLKDRVQAHPSEQYYSSIQAVQISRYPTAYAQWRTEAERIVTAYGFVDGSSAAWNNQWATTADAATSGDYEFYRGLPPTSRLRKQKFGSSWGKESSWDCIQRLAGEVNWRAFFVSGTFYFISEDDLLKSKPVAVLDENSPGVIAIDGDYDEGKKAASVTVTCFASRWSAPPGSVIQLKNMGPWNGRWLVNDIRRSLFDPQAEITLKKKSPRLPEPSGSNLINTGEATWSGTPLPPADDPSAAERGVPVGNAQQLAKQLVLLAGVKWMDDNGKGLAQIRKVAAGLQLSGAAGMVFMDPGPMRTVLWLINQGYTIGTFAWCEDHSNDGLQGHAGGKSVDISSINGIPINQDSNKCRKLVVEIDKLLHDTGAPITPRQLITGGYGNHRDLEISNFSIPAADSFYGGDTMSGHCNHIHVGY